MFMFRMRIAIASIVTVLCIASAWGQDRAPADPSKGRAPIGPALACPSCDDADFCTVDSCDTGTGTCRHDPLSCDDGNPCTRDFCQNIPTNRGCAHVPVPDATPCDDGSTCTLEEACSGGACVPGEILGWNTPCDDGNSCTVSDACDPFKQCVGTPVVGGECDDANACTREDRCVAGPDGTAICEGTGPDCADGDLCTEDRCDPATGMCLHPPVDCADGNTCTTDACDPATGLCRRDNVAGSCFDGLFCTTGETCVGGNCVGAEPIVCPQPQCGSNRCQEEDRGCRFSDFGGNACPAGGECYSYQCINNHCQQINSGPDRCDPHTPCGIGRCIRGACMLDVTIPCNDGNSCTEDVCSGGAFPGCAPVPKVDGTPCAASLCATGVCQSGVCNGATPVSCDDGNPCTRDSCDPVSGCQHVAGGCNDGNPCTADSCTASNTCQYLPLAAGIPCDDGNSCTHQDTCLVNPGVGMVCAGNGPSCDDGNPCTNDALVAVEDLCVCENLPADNACCSAGSPISCDDSNPCTADRCEPGIGCVHGGMGTPNPPPDTCNGLDDDCDGQVDERELFPMCAVRPLIMRDGGALKTFTVTCRWKPACPGAPVPAPLDEIRQVWLSAADLLLDSADNAPLPNPLTNCDLAIVEDPAKRMTGDAAVTFVFDEDGDGVCGTGGLGRAGLMFHLADVPDGKLARVCIRGLGMGSERCGIVLVRHDTATGPQPIAPGGDERKILLPAP